MVKRVRQKFQQKILQAHLETFGLTIINIHSVVVVIVHSFHTIYKFGRYITPNTHPSYNTNIVLCVLSCVRSFVYVRLFAEVFLVGRSVVGLVSPRRVAYYCVICNKY